MDGTARSPDGSDATFATARPRLGRDDEGLGQLVVRQGRRVRAAHQSRRGRGRRVAHDHERRRGRDEPRPGRPPPPAGRGARTPAQDGRPPVAVPERHLRGAHRRRTGQAPGSGHRRDRLRRPLPGRHPRLPRAGARRDRPRRPVPALATTDRRARPRDARRRAARGDRLRRPEPGAAGHRREGVERGADREPPERRRPVRGERRVPHVRHRRAGITRPVDVAVGDTVERDGFLYAPLTARGPSTG